MTTALLDQLINRGHILGTGNGSYRYTASSEAVQKKRGSIGIDHHLT